MNNNISFFDFIKRLLIYPIALLLVVGGIVGLYASLFEMKNDLKAIMGVLYFSIIIVAIVYFIYYDIRKLLDLDNAAEGRERNDLLDDI